ncbi:hypothetical protein PR048_005202, partial [Dryococelus australis]
MLDTKKNFWLCGMSILALKNDMVSHLNTMTLEKIAGDSTTYMSINTICSEDESAYIPVQFLGSIFTPGLLAYEIQLKIGVPIILLHNLNPQNFALDAISKCFAMTINKSQGQTLGRPGIDLSQSCFTHGQLYVAYSHGSNSKNVILADNNRLQNIYTNIIK